MLSNLVPGAHNATFGGGFMNANYRRMVCKISVIIDTLERLITIIKRHGLGL